MNLFSAAWRLVLAGAAAVVCVILVVNAITQPVASEQRLHTAEFTDASGLHPGADVRIRGMRVGKVETIALHRSAGRSLAQVAFTLDDRYRVVPATRMAIRYQALTGLRYVDVVDAAEGTPESEGITNIPTSMTQPSFDITELFNGLQPVFATLSPDDLNTFTTNVQTFLSGDGTGLGPVLESVQTLTRFLADRQQVVSTLLQNLTHLADNMTGHSKQFIQILDWSNRLIDAAVEVLDEFRKSAIYGPAFTQALVQLLDNAGINKDANLDDGLDKAFTNLDDTISAFKLVPAMWDNIPPPGQSGQVLECSLGRAELPLPVDVLLNGQKVTLCNK